MTTNKTAPGTISGGKATVVRTVSAADTPPLVDSNCDPTTACIAQGWRSLKVFLRFTGGTNPTATVQVLHRMTSVAGNGWIAGPLWTGLADGDAMQLDVFGRDVFFAVTALSGSPSSVAVWCAGWEPVHQQGGPYR